MTVPELHTTTKPILLIRLGRCTGHFTWNETVDIHITRDKK